MRPKKTDWKRFKILIDDREKTPFEFDRHDEFQLYGSHPQTARVRLATGDYTVEGLESNIIVERKSIADLVQTLTAQDRRVRFFREVERMNSARHRAVVVVGGYQDIGRVCNEVQDHIARIRGAVASLVAGGIPVTFFDHHYHGAKFTFDFLCHAYGLELSRLRIAQGAVVRDAIEEAGT